MTTKFSPQRKILHLDLDAFFCAVEEKYQPDLRGKPFAVGGSPDARGVVASCSYAARRFGVRSAMPMARALRLCPDLLVLTHRHGKYGEESREVMKIVREMAGKVEQISIDEAFLDVSNSPEPGEALARRLQARILAEMRLPCSIGVATNKLVAKIATDFGKGQAKTDGPPNAVCVVPPGEEASFLAPLPASALWGVGPKTAARLAEFGMHTIGDIASRPAGDLVRLFGMHGESLARGARGENNSPVEESHEVKSISRETTFAKDVRDWDRLQETLRQLSEGVARQLRKAGLAGATVKIKVRWPDFTTFTHQTTLPHPTDQEEVISSAAIDLFKAKWVPPGKPVRLLGVGMSSLTAASEMSRQLTLWESASNPEPEESPDVAAKKQRLDQAVESLQERFGEGTIRKGGIGKLKVDP
jgi:DNA polymerase-4